MSLEWPTVKLEEVSAAIDVLVPTDWKWIEDRQHPEWTKASRLAVQHWKDAMGEIARLREQLTEAQHATAATQWDLEHVAKAYNQTLDRAEAAEARLTEMRTALVEFGVQARSVIDEQDATERIAMAWDLLHSMVESAALASTPDREWKPSPSVEDEWEYRVQP